MFEHRKVQMYTTQPRVTLTSPNKVWKYTGPAFFDLYAGEPFRPYGDQNLGYSTGALNTYGSEAISRAYPTKPSADLMVALAEIMREGLPGALFSAIASQRGNSKRDAIKNTAGDYLNYIFGIVPLVREADNLFKAILDMDKIVNQLVRDSGRLVRRSRTMVDSTEHLHTYRTRDYPSLRVPGGTFSTGVMFDRNEPAPIIEVNQTLVKKVRFSGAFQYWLPHVLNEGSDFASLDPAYAAKNTLSIATQVYGLRATPKAAWNLLPFSWLVDWFVNVGVLFENADAMGNYGLVMPYGYVTGEQKLITNVSVDLSGTKLGETFGTISSSTIDIVQKRTRATPYGFGLKDVDLNSTQWAILGALGLSRMPSK